MKTKSNNISVEHIQRPLPFKIANLIGGLKSKIFQTPTLSADKLVSDAVTKSPSQTPLDPQFLSALNILIEAINASTQLDYTGRIFAKQTLKTALTNQIQVQDTFNEITSIEKEKINRPLFVIGFPRTGTTFIHNLLALDENSRAPKMWEVINPGVVSQLSNKEREARIKQAEKFVKLAYYLLPELQAIHELFPDGPDECLKLIENTFISPHFCLYFDIPDYWQWLINQNTDNFVHTYRSHKKQLQTLQYGCPTKHWVLKTPVHLFFLDALLKVYPDACVVHMQRDPLECIPSFCSLVGVNRALFSNDIDMNEIGKFSVEFYAECNKRVINAKRNAPSGSVIDIQYRSFIDKPKDTIKEIYNYFGMDFTHLHGQKIDAWLNNHPKNKHGVHKYTLEQFGLTRDDIDSNPAFSS